MEREGECVQDDLFACVCDKAVQLHHHSLSEPATVQAALHSGLRLET